MDLHLPHLLLQVLNALLGLCVRLIRAKVWVLGGAKGKERRRGLVGKGEE